jgi:hypothetical protein
MLADGYAFEECQQAPVYELPPNIMPAGEPMQTLSFKSGLPSRFRDLSVGLPQQLRQISASCAIMSTLHRCTETPERASGASRSRWMLLARARGGCAHGGELDESRTTSSSGSNGRRTKSPERSMVSIRLEASSRGKTQTTSGTVSGPRERSDVLLERVRALNSLRLRRFDPARSSVSR